jgi:hypothetical protein
MMVLLHAPDGLKTFVAMVGKGAITGAFAICYLWPMELFPTPVRSLAIGLCGARFPTKV